MPNNSHTVLICTAALKQDTNNMWRGLSNPLGIPYDLSPVNSSPGTHTVPLAGTLIPETPWTTPPTHWMASSWELPTFVDLLAALKAGNIPTRDWLPFNLTQTRARAAGQSLRAWTVNWLGSEFDADASLQRVTLMDANIAAALAEMGLQKVPGRPTPV